MSNTKPMTDKQVNALLDVLTEQRNVALNSLAEASANNRLFRVRITELEEGLQAAQVELTHLRLQITSDPLVLNKQEQDRKAA